MANDFLTTQSGPIARTALAILRRSIVLPSLVYRDFQNDFRGGQGDTVTIRKPATLTARRYTRATDPNSPNSITLDNVTETGVSVTLDTYSYSAVAIPDEDAVLEIANFATQVLAPQVQAVAEDMEDALATTFASLAATNDITVSSGDADPSLELIPAHTFLSENKVPQAGRVLVMGSQFAGVMLADDRVSRVDASGTDTALRTAQFSPMFGFTPYESLAIPSDTAYAFVREAVGMATVTLPNPRGATASETVNDSGMTLRWLSDYDGLALQDRSIVSGLSGGAIIDANRIVRLKLGA